MTAAELEQVLFIRTLRAEKAERALRLARDLEAQARGAVEQARGQLAAFDRNTEETVESFFDRRQSGTSPGNVHSAMQFHSNLAVERVHILRMIEELEHTLADASGYRAQALSHWAKADSAARNLRDLHTRAALKEKRTLERRLEQEMDELSLARMWGATH